MALVARVIFAATGILPTSAKSDTTKHQRYQEEERPPRLTPDRRSNYDSSQHEHGYRDRRSTSPCDRRRWYRLLGNALLLLLTARQVLIGQRRVHFRVQLAGSGKRRHQIVASFI